MLLDEVHFGGLVRIGGTRKQIVQKRDDVGKRITEDPAHVAQHVDAGSPAHLIERDELVPHDATGSLLHAPRADELEDDSDALSLGLDGVETPQVHAHRLRVGSVVSRAVLLDDGARDTGAPVRRRGARHPVRVERVDVTSGGEHAGTVAKKISSGRGGYVFAAQCPDDSGELLRVLPEQIANLNGFREGVVLRLLGRILLERALQRRPDVIQ